MMTLTCGCKVSFNKNDPDDRYCAEWYNHYQHVQDSGDMAYYSHSDEYCYGSICDKCLKHYNARRCKLGGSYGH